MYLSAYFLTIFPLLAPTLCPASVTVANVSQLLGAVEQANLGGDPEILLQDGNYVLAGMLWIDRSGVTVRSLSGIREEVTIRGQGMSGGVTHIFNVAASGFTIRDLTLREVSQHAVQLQPGVDDALLSNLHILDTGEQMVKVACLYDSVQDQCFASPTSDNGILENSLLEYSAGIGPQFYIGGIDAHNAIDWIVRDNIFRFIRSPSNEVAEHAVHFWSNSRNTLVERNRIINCDRGIGFGLGDRGHGSGVIRNNLLYNDDTESDFADVGIALESAQGVDVYNNTLLQLSGYPNAIEYRFGGTLGGDIVNNLTNAAIRSRDDGAATVANNYLTADASWFMDAASGDLLLNQAVPWVVDQGQEISSLIDDFENETRPQGHGVDIGADEWNGCVSQGAVSFSERQFVTDTLTRCRSFSSITTGQQVTVEPGASLFLLAPWIELLPGLSIAHTASLQVNAASGALLSP